MHCWGELESLGGHSVGEVRLVVRTIFRICGNESQPGLQIVEELAMPLAYYSSQLLGGWVTLGHFPFVRTDRPAHSHRNENFSLNQN